MAAAVVVSRGESRSGINRWSPCCRPRKSRSITFERRSIRFRVHICHRTPCSVTVGALTKPRKVPTCVSFYRSFTRLRLVVDNAVTHL